MITLEHYRIHRRFGDLHCGASRPIADDVLVYRDTVIHDSFELCIFYLHCCCVEARRPEPGVVELPLARGPAGVAARCKSAETSSVIPAFIDAASVTVGQRSV